MVFNSTDGFRRLYDSPILNRQAYSSNYMDYNTNFHDNYLPDRDYNRYNHPKDNYNGDLNYNSNYEYGKYNGLNSDKYNVKFDKYSSNNHLNNGYSNNYTNNGYSNNYLSTNGGMANKYKSDNLFDNDTHFELPNYLKSVETYTPNRFNDNYSPTRLHSGPNYPNLSSNKYQNYNLNSTKFNLNGYKYDNNTSNRIKSHCQDDWKRDNYLNISNSPNLKFNTQFYPHNYSSLNEQRHYKELKDSLNYAQNRDKLERIRRNLNSVSLSGLGSLQNGHYNSHTSGLDLFSNGFDSNLNGDFNSKLYSGANGRSYNADGFKYNCNPPPSSAGLSANGLSSKCNGLDSYSRYVDAQERASPSSGLHGSDLDQFNIDELYDRVKEQKQQLLQLKSSYR